MPTLDLPKNIIKTLATVLEQLHQVLPAPKQETDFSAFAFHWQDKQLKAIQNPKAMRLDDLKALNAKKQKFYKILNNFSKAFLPMIFYSLAHEALENHLLFAHCCQPTKIKVYV